MRHFATKWAAVKFVKPWMSNLFYTSRDPSSVGPAMWSECTRKYLRGKPCCLHPLESGPGVDQRPGGVITSPTLLGLIFVWCNMTIRRCWKLSFFRPLRTAATLLKGKTDVKMNEYCDSEPIWWLSHPESITVLSGFCVFCGQDSFRQSRPTLIVFLENFITVIISMLSFWWI